MVAGIKNSYLSRWNSHTGHVSSDWRNLKTLEEAASIWRRGKKIKRANQPFLRNRTCANFLPTNAFRQRNSHFHLDPRDRVAIGNDSHSARGKLMNAIRPPACGPSLESPKQKRSDRVRTHPSLLSNRAALNPRRAFTTTDRFYRSLRF